MGLLFSALDCFHLVSLQPFLARLHYIYIEYHMVSAVLGAVVVICDEFGMGFPLLLVLVLWVGKYLPKAGMLGMMQVKAAFV